jgi:hypothetical protein
MSKGSSELVPSTMLTCYALRPPAPACGFGILLTPLLLFQRFDIASTQTIAQEIAKTVHNNSDTKWTISLEVTCDWLGNALANVIANPMGPPFAVAWNLPIDKWWLPKCFTFNCIPLADELPELAPGTERVNKQQPGWPHFEQYLKEDKSSWEVWNELPRKLAAARQLVGSFVHEIQQLMRENDHGGEYSCGQNDHGGE